jgi:enoyl-CoA hydratase
MSDLARLPEYETIRLEWDGPLTWLVFNRPEKRNALSRQLLDEVGAALDVLAKHGATRVIAFRGEGSCFSAGYDIQRPAGPGAGTDIVDDFDRLASNVERFLQVWDHPKPVIAAIHGHCLAGASQLAVCCDITIVADDAVIGTPTIPIGGGYITPMWVPLVGPKRAKQMSFVAGSTISGAEAAAWGWANYSVPAAELLTEVRRLSGEIAKTPAKVLRMKKLAINRVVDLAGFRNSLLMGAETDALLHYSQPVEELRATLREVGVKETIKRFHAESSSTPSSPPSASRGEDATNE